MQTYVPNQDRNKLFLCNPLRDITTMNELYQFTYPEITRYAKTVDVAWFNDRNMPHAFFEIEHSTDIQNSILKFYELQDFNSNFYIVADDYRERLFCDIMNRSVFKLIKNRIKFISYESLSSIHTHTHTQNILRLM